jgi:hypothetical protein
VQHCRKDNVLGSASEAKHLCTLVKTSTIQVDASGASIYLNGLQLGEVADFEAIIFNLALMLLEIQMFNLALNPPFCQTAVIGCAFISLLNSIINRFYFVRSYMFAF